MARRRDEPFNPFTSGSSPRSRGRDAQRKKPAVEETAQVEGPIDRKALQEAMIAKVLATADEKLPVEEEISQPEPVEATVEPAVVEETVSEPAVVKEPVHEPVKKVKTEAPKKVAKPKPPQKPKQSQSKQKAVTTPELSNLDDLKRRSQELAVKTGHEAAPAPAQASVSTSIPVKPEPVATARPGPPLIKPKPKQQRRYRKTKTGGGRQPKQAKLDRRKQLEFRFDIRRILDNPSVAEEHRSNLQGQVWAKGERIGIDAANEYVEQKKVEGLIDDDVAAQLLKLIRIYTTKR